MSTQQTLEELRHLIMADQVLKLQAMKLAIKSCKANSTPCSLDEIRGEAERIYEWLKMDWPGYEVEPKPQS